MTAVLFPYASLRRGTRDSFFSSIGKSPRRVVAPIERAGTFSHDGEQFAADSGD
jgi:hypothetical protein